MESLFNLVRESVVRWVKGNEEFFSSKEIIVEIINDTDTGFYAVLNFGECMGAVVVDEPSCAPYRFVSFDAITMEEDVTKLVYAWYDDEDVTVEQILVSLDNAIDVVLNYQRGS